MNVLHNCSVLGVTREDGVALVKFSFLTQMTLTEHHGMQATLLSAFYVGSWEANNIALGYGELPNAQKFQKTACAVDITPHGGLVEDVQSGKST